MSNYYIDNDFPESLYKNAQEKDEIFGDSFPETLDDIKKIEVEKYKDILFMGMHSYEIYERY